MDDYIVKISDVCKTYDNFALDHISLNIPSGCIVGLIGENGAGKTTLMKLILNQIRCEQGNIEVFGKDNIRQERAVKEDMGVVMGDLNLPESFTARDTDRVMNGIFSNWDSQIYRNYLDRFALPARKRVKDYSRGMKMKLALAIALSHRARLLLLDEPTSGLDPVARDEILDLFMEFIQDETHSIFLSSHIISDLEHCVDYIALLHQGKLVFHMEKDILLETHGLLRCSGKDLEDLPQSAVIGSRSYAYGVESLVRRDRLGGNLSIEPASLESIMLYYIKGGNV